MKKTLLLFATFAFFGTLFAQEPVGTTSKPTNVRDYTDEQKDETDPVILRRLDEWQDLKFGFMAHWGIYAQWGVVESWSICSEPWIDRKGEPYDEYKHKYMELNKTFNPKKFNPDRWAKAAANAGMKYMVFTTKHHDGFCMFSTAETPYSSVHSSCPFFKNKNSDITGALVDAFRERGSLVAGAERCFCAFRVLPDKGKQGGFPAAFICFGYLLVPRLFFQPAGGRLPDPD